MHNYVENWIVLELCSTYIRSVSPPLFYKCTSFLAFKGLMHSTLGMTEERGTNMLASIGQISAADWSDCHM